jgi:hypothetical protein
MSNDSPEAEVTAAADAAAVPGNIEECVDALGEYLGALNRYPLAVLAVALRLHLGGLLRALQDSGELSDAATREFLLDLDREARG